MEWLEALDGWDREREAFRGQRVTAMRYNQLADAYSEAHTAWCFAVQQDDSDAAQRLSDRVQRLSVLFDRNYKRHQAFNKQLNAYIF